MPMNLVSYQCQPSKTLHLKSEKCSGGKQSKIRLTGMVAANALGEKLPLFVIGKAANTLLQKREVSAMPLQKSEEKLDGWSLV